MSKGNIDDKTIITLAFIAKAEDITGSMVDSNLLKQGGLLDKAKKLEKEGLLSSGSTHYGKIIENTSYTITPQGMKILEDYVRNKTGISAEIHSDALAYHRV